MVGPDHRDRVCTERVRSRDYAQTRKTRAPKQQHLGQRPQPCWQSSISPCFPQARNIAAGGRVESWRAAPVMGRAFANVAPSPMVATPSCLRRSLSGWQQVSSQSVVTPLSPAGLSVCLLGRLRLPSLLPPPRLSLSWSVVGQPLLQGTHSCSTLHQPSFLFCREREASSSSELGQNQTTQVP